MTLKNLFGFPLMNPPYFDLKNCDFHDYLFPASLSRFINIDLANENALLACFSAFFFQIVRRVFVFVFEARFFGTAIFFYSFA